MLAEFGIGLNEKVETLIGFEAVDEKNKATAHIALGMNCLFVGKNGSPVHFDFVFTPSRILIDGITVMEGSRLLI